MKKTFLHGIVAGILASVAGIIYLNIYKNTLGVEFSKIINIGSISGASVFACMLMSLGYFLLEKFKKQNLKGLLNIVIAVSSFACILLPISIDLPFDIKTPELFPGLAVPLLFFPALAFFCIAPFFSSSPSREKNPTP